MNAPSEPRPMNRNPSSRWRGSADASRSRIPAALPAASAAVVDPFERVEIARVVEAARERRGCATGRSGRRTGRRRRRWRRSPAACSTALGDSIWMMPRIRAVDRLDVRVAELAEARATRRQGEPARAVGRIAHERDGLAGLVGRVHPRDHDPVRAEVERPPDPQSLAGLRSDERGGRRGAQRVEVGEQVGFGRRRRARGR